jgi:hypothetical protein
MAKKMYYTEQEAAAKVGGPAALADLVKTNKLRAYPDGPRKVFKVDDVAPLATADVELTPVGASLSDADQARPAGKEDTVITAEGISIFDDEDLEIDTADPLAKTQIAPSVEDQISLEGVGSGSGLLDLTRESDDTSLGAEVLDHIDMEGQVPSGLQEASSVPQATGGYPAPSQAMMVEPTYVEETDAGAGLFGGMLVGLAIGVIILATTAPAAMHVTLPGFLEWLADNKPAIIGIIVVLSGLCALVGWMMSKNAAARQAMKRGA